MKWVSMWGCAQSFAERREADFAKNLTVRYTIRAPFSGEKLRLHLSAVCNSCDAPVTKVFAAPHRGDRKSGKAVSVTFGGKMSAVIPAGEIITSDEIDYPVKAGEDIDISMYFGDFTEIATSSVVLGPLMRAYFAEGDYAAAEEIPMDASQSAGSYLFLDTVDVMTDDNNRAVIAFGDSITAQSWVDFANLTLMEKNSETTIIRRGVSGARVLGQYDALSYRHYGMSGKNRFVRETTAAGADSVIIFIGVNDIIHPDGINPYRPMENFPSEEELRAGLEYFIDSAHERGMKAYTASILPFGGWRTDADFREERRLGINRWILSDNKADGYFDFAAAVADETGRSLKKEYDSGDHLHPNRAGAAEIAKAVTDNMN